MEVSKKYSHVIWDWNGTLFNDVAWCMEVINKMLVNRNITPLDSISAYQDVFCFPIIQYYKNLGFDFEKEPFEDLAKEYINLYHSANSGNCKLHDDSKYLLESIQDKNIKQIILSASETSNLLSQISKFNISHHFDEILGISNIYAKSKVDIGLDYAARNGLENGVLIGDTQHDQEVAKALGVDCLLVAAGHQSKKKLLTCGAPVLDSLSQAIKYFH